MFRWINTLFYITEFTELYISFRHSKNTFEQDHPSFMSTFKVLLRASSNIRIVRNFTKDSTACLLIISSNNFTVNRTMLLITFPVTVSKSQMIFLKSRKARQMFELGSGQSTLVLYWVFTVFMSGFSCKYSLKSSLHRQWYTYKDLSTVKIELKSSSGLVKCSLQHNQFSPWHWE